MKERRTELACFECEDGILRLTPDVAYETEINGQKHTLSVSMHVCDKCGDEAIDSQSNNEITEKMLELGWKPNYRKPKRV